MWFALLSPDLLSILAALVLLVVVPVFVVLVLAVVSGYIQHDAEQRLAVLSEESQESENGTDARENRGDENR
ncbi:MULTISPECIES: hypothetical protein [Natrialbaceae]|uniref:hypothetical protein n=1 Tax=Natrialbaceae TaxID=1644061 RepID=UPI00207CAF6B|nr:hypothetical protein [Natronococcus sp. CG52]